MRVRYIILYSMAATNAQATQSDQDLAWWPAEARPLSELRGIESS